MRGAEQVIDDLAADHELRHQREQRNGDEQIRVEVSEDDVADAAEVTLGRIEHGGSEQREPGEDRYSGQ